MTYGVSDQESCECLQQNKLLAAFFDAIEAAGDSFETRFGLLSEHSDFELYGQYLQEAVASQNVIEGTNYDPVAMLELWSQHVEYCIKDEMTRWMEEALASTPIGDPD